MKLLDSKHLILFNSERFFIPYFKANGVLVSDTFGKKSFLSRFVRKIYRTLNLHLDYWYNDWKLELKSIDTIIVFAPTFPDVIRFINKYNPKIRIIYWYWNPVFRIGMPNKTILSLAEIWSFDPNDCQFYNMRFNTTFYFSTISLENSRLKRDVLFLGHDKGRRNELERLENKLRKLKISTYFHIVSDPHEKKDKNSPRIPYTKYLTLLSESKAIVDVQPLGQSGLTLRVMESIFFEKKLITNNLSILSMDFYNPQNIFIIGKDDEALLKTFINTNYIPLSSSIIAQYDFTHWLERFKR